MDPVGSQSLDQHMNSMQLRDSNSDGSPLIGQQPTYSPLALLQCPQSGYLISLNLEHQAPGVSQTPSPMPSSSRTAPSARKTLVKKSTTTARAQLYPNPRTSLGKTATTTSRVKRIA